MALSKTTLSRALSDGRLELGHEHREAAIASGAAGRSGIATAAPMAAGSAQPIAPGRPEEATCPWMGR